MRTVAKLTVLALLTSPVFAQTAPPPPPPPPPSTQFAATQPASSAGTASVAAPTKFEAADVRFTAPYRVPFYAGAFLHNGRYIIRQATMAQLIATAYNFKQGAYVGGGPTWLSWDRYDIEAKVPAGATLESARPMLQKLLAERFKLVVHPGNVPLPAYLLTVANGKPNFKPSTSTDGSCKFQAPSNSGPDSIPTLGLHCSGATMASLVSSLENLGGGAGYVPYGIPMIDDTGLKGGYDFDLKWTPKYFLQKAGPNGISLFHALEELGLRLEMKTTPRPGIVVDRVNEQPTPNAPDLATVMPPLPPPEFEVATIRPSAPGEKGGGRMTKDELDFKAVPLKFLITWAWDLNPRDSNTLVAPKWIDSDQIDIHAKIAESDVGTNSMGRQVNFDDLRPMVRALLIDRFQMKIHMEDRPVDSYTLVAVDPKLTKAGPTERTSCGTAPPDGGKDPRLTNVMLDSIQTCTNTSMDQFAGQLHRIASDYFFYPVKNATGLKGSWDFTLSWSSAHLTQAQTPVPSQAGSSEGVATASDPNGALSFFDALRKQLGLKLIKEKQPESVLVIDSISEQPVLD